MALITGKNWREHRPYFVGIAIIALLCIISFVYVLFNSTIAPTGSHPLCLLFGILAALIILFESLLWLRKKYRTWRAIGVYPLYVNIGSPYLWMKLHIWLGLLSIPLVILHTGFFLGGPLAIALLLVFFLTIISGVMGLILQNILPRRMFEQVPHETIYSQIDRLILLLRNDSRDQVRLVKPNYEFPTLIKVDEQNSKSFATELKKQDVNIVGAHAMASVSYKTISSLKTKFIRVGEEEAMIVFCNTHLDSFLLPKVSKSHQLFELNNAQKLFAELRMGSQNELKSIIDNLEFICNERREMIVQKNIQFWLHSWLFLHYPLTVLLLALLLVHIIQSIRYW